AVDVPALVRAMWHADSVEVVGEVEDAHAYLESADVVVMPSDNPEPFGLVAIEAFARGRPVIGSDAGGLADIVEHGRTGWLYPAGDAEALAGLIAGLTRDAVREAGRRARVSYEQSFTTARFEVDWISALDFATRTDPS
ncbi:MAG: glycosyltransferase family 4 protein, partial [Marmoricola sp.]|nr:glycosyltransferase family 4 protein [Marmoricola sp.]